MEKIEKKRELSVAELEGHKAEMVPDRIEMRRRKGGFRNVAFSGARFGDNLDVSNEETTVIIVSGGLLD